MKLRILQWLAIILMFQSGVLHLLDAQDEYQKIPYMGYITIGFVFGVLVATLLIYRRFWIGWVIGLIVATSSIMLFVLTRTVALPGLAVDQWLYPFWLVAVIAEALYLLLFLVAGLWTPSVSVDGNSASPLRLSFLFPIFGVIFISGITYGTSAWDVFAFQFGYHHHVGSLGAVCNTPVTSFDELEERYGLKLVQMNISMMDGIVDVRLMVTDPDKAQFPLQDQAALLVNQEVLILAPHRHIHWQLRKDKAHIMFFPTLNNTIQSGSEVSLVLGRVRVEPVIIQ